MLFIMVELYGKSIKFTYLIFITMRLLTSLLILFMSIVISPLYAQEELLEMEDYVKVESSYGSFNRGCELDNTCFIPYEIFIEKGQTVHWLNSDDASHNVVSGDPVNGPAGIFNSALLRTSEEFTFEFEQEGIFPYYCSIHPWMIGYVIVGLDETNIEDTLFDFQRQPKLYDKDFQVEEFVTDLSVPISIEFIDDSILVLQKNDGKIRIIKDGVLEKKPILDLEVANYGEMGLLGITQHADKVYLYFTEAHHDGGLALGNRIYKFTWNGQNLVDPVLLKEIVASSQSYIGGAMTADSAGRVFIAIGDQYKMGLLQNFKPENSYVRSGVGTGAFEKQDRGKVFLESIRYAFSCTKVSFQHYTTNPYSWQKEQPTIEQNPLETNPFFVLENLGSCFKKFYFDNFEFGHWKDTGVILQIEPEVETYAIGIRNSFGLTVDPLTGNLWATENGPDRFDEINLITELHNGGWAKIIGPAKNSLDIIEETEKFTYSDPEFSWEQPIGITSLTFVTSDKFTKYENWLFVADTNHGNIYKFKLNSEHTDFVFEDKNLADLVVNIDPLGNGTNERMDEILFGTGFGIISDMKFGPDGNLYVVSLFDNIIYRIFPI